MKLSIGADPELFLMENDKFISAYEVIPGTKEKPFPVDKGAVQVDGMALEINITPANSLREFSNNIDTVLLQLREMIPEEFDISTAPIANFDRKYMARQPQVSKQLGCEPDYDAYTGFQNPPPQEHPTMRTAAGHVHLGWTEGADPTAPAHFQSCRDLAIQMDYYLGLHSVMHDRDNKRREMYGQPGAFRPKTYGMEYRVLSNYWLLSPNYIKLIYLNALHGFEMLVNEDFKADDYIRKEYSEVIDANAKATIESGNRSYASRFHSMIGIK